MLDCINLKSYYRGERLMNADQKTKCQYIIHSHAVAAAAGNIIPVPGLGFATDIVVMTSMTMSLCAVFGGSIQEEAAKIIAITTIKNTMLKQPIKVITKELSKIVPFLGQVVSPTVSVVVLESAGWALATELEEKFADKQAQRLIKEKEHQSIVASYDKKGNKIQAEPVHAIESEQSSSKFSYFETLKSVLLPGKKVDKETPL